MYTKKELVDVFNHYHMRWIYSGFTDNEAIKVAKAAEALGNKLDKEE